MLAELVYLTDVDGTGAGYGLCTSCGAGFAVREGRLHGFAIAAEGR